MQRIYDCHRLDGGRMLENLKIRTRLIAGFGIVVLFLAVAGVISLRNQDEMSGAMQNFYDHPFQVTRAMGVADAHIVRMHRAMKDVVLYAGNPQELDQALKDVDASEKIVYEQLAIVQE